MVNIYAVKNNNVDSKSRNRPSRKDVKEFNALEQSNIERYFADYLGKLERATPPAPEKQFYQLLAKIKD